MKLHRSVWVCFVALMACSSTQPAGTSTTPATTESTGGTGTEAAEADAATAPVEAADAATMAATEDAATTAATDAAAAPADGGPPMPWATMTHEQKADYMEHTVMPEMRSMFQAQNPTRFARFTCGTCHGANARAVNFHMPNGIAPLDPARVPAMFSTHTPMNDFMTQHVWPRMTQLLGAQPYNPETHQGFGCFGCHGTRGARPGAAPAATTAHPAAAH